MSADNTIVILVTKQSNSVQRAYRVAHVFAFDELDWLRKNKPSDIPDYLQGTFKNSPKFEDMAGAQLYANTLLSTIRYVEYGIVTSEVDIILKGD